RHHDLFRLGEQDAGGLPGPGHGADVDHVGAEIGLAQSLPPPGGQGDVPLALVALLGVVVGGGMAEQIDCHSLHSPFKTSGRPQKTRTTHPARAASRQASRPAFSRAARWAGSAGTTPPPSSVKITIS